MEDDQISRIENKLDKVVDKIGRVDVTLAAQHVSIADHIRRTNLLEAQIQPIDDAYKMAKGVVKFLAAACTGAAAIEAIIHYFIKG